MGKQRCSSTSKRGCLAILLRAIMHVRFKPQNSCDTNDKYEWVVNSHKRAPSHFVIQSFFETSDNHGKGQQGGRVWQNQNWKDCIDKQDHLPGEQHGRGGFVSYHRRL